MPHIQHPLTKDTHRRARRSLRVAWLLMATGALGAAAAVGCSSRGDAGEAAGELQVGPDAGKGLVISQVYGGGGAEVSPFKSDYVELFNQTNEDIPLDGLVLQYGTGTSDIGTPIATFGTGKVVPANGYFLIAFGKKSADAFPDADLKFTTELDESAAKIALVRGSKSLDCGKDGKCANKARVVDMVGYGKDTKSFESKDGGSGVATLNALTAAVRKAEGCQDTDDNKSDFDVDAFEETPFGPHTKDARRVCTDDPQPVADAGADVTDTPTTQSKGLVISHVYGGGGNTGAAFKNDFVVLFNNSDEDVSLNGLSLQYAGSKYDIGSAAPDAGAPIEALPNKTVAAHKYFLVSLASRGDNGTALPQPVDHEGTLDLGSKGGKVALVKGTDPINCGKEGGRCDAAKYISLLGWGDVSDSEGSPAGATDNSHSVYRKGGGCVGSNDNSKDFITIKAIEPTNSATQQQSCPADLAKDPAEDTVAPTTTNPRPDAGARTDSGTTSTTGDDEGTGTTKTPRNHDVDAGKGVPTNANSYEGGCSTSSQNGGSAGAVGLLGALGLALMGRRRSRARK